jgi:hypothetical protein
VEEALAREDAEKWQEAIDKELGVLVKNGTWEPAVLPAGKKAIKVKWVFVIKRNKDGGIERYKGRVVAKGFMQRPGFDYGDVFAPTARLTTVRTVFSVATTLDWELEQMDVEGAFLQGPIPEGEEIYIEVPDGYDPGEIGGQKAKVLRLRKALYGLKQAPRLWNKELDAYLRSLGLQPCVSDEALYVRRDEAGQPVMIAVVYVDDMLLSCKGKARMRAMKQELSSRFCMKDLGAVSFYLGIQVERDRERRVTHLHQATYIKKLLERFNLEEAKPVGVPLPPKKILAPAPEEEDGQAREGMEGVPYASLVGALLYAAVCTRPDISFAVSQLSRHCSNPTMEHWEAAKRVLRYLKRSPTLGVVFEGARGLVLECYTDADFSTCPHTSRSTSGQVHLLGGGAVFWRSKRQDIVALSTTEAEYVAMADAGKTLVWLRELLEELGLAQGSPTTLFSDNQSAIALVKDPVHHERTKHIRRRFHYIRELVAEQDAAVSFCPTEEQLADLLTKAVPRQQMLRLLDGMGVRPGQVGE